MNESTHDIFPLPNRHSSTAAATPQHPNPYELILSFNYEDNPLSCWSFVDRNSLSKDIQKTGEIFSRSSGKLESLGGRNKSRDVHLVQAMTQRSSKIILKYDTLCLLK